MKTTATEKIQLVNLIIFFSAGLYAFFSACVGYTTLATITGITSALALVGIVATILISNWLYSRRTASH